jgi:DNA-binding CsgD family transcriptional regulator
VTLHTDPNKTGREKTMTRAAIVQSDRSDQLISQLYQNLADTDRQSEDCLEALRQAVNARNMTLLMVKKKPTITEYIVNAGEAPREKVSEYNANRYWSMRPEYEYNPGELVLIDDTSRTTDSLIAGRYSQYLSSIDVIRWLSMKICTIDDTDYIVTGSRSHADSPFSADDGSLFSVLWPHFATALSLRWKVLRSKQISNIYGDAIDGLGFGVIVLDARGRIVEMNGTAMRLLDHRDGLMVMNGTLHASLRTDDAKLQRMIRDVLQGDTGGEAEAKGGATAVTRPSGQRDLGVVVASLRANSMMRMSALGGAKIFIRDPEAECRQSPHMLRDLYGFTQAEADLAIGMANGLSIDQLRERFHIRRNTVRAHLRSMFVKANATRQAELVRVILNGVTPIYGHDRRGADLGSMDKLETIQKN